MHAPTRRAGSCANGRSRNARCKSCDRIDWIGAPSIRSIRTRSGLLSAYAPTDCLVWLCTAQRVRAREGEERRKFSSRRPCGVLDRLCEPRSFYSTRERRASSGVPPREGLGRGRPLQGDVDEEESARWSWLLRRPPFIASSTMAGVFSRNAFAALVRLLCPPPPHPPRPPTSSVRRGENELAASRPGARPRRALVSRLEGGASRHTRMLTCV